MYHNDPPSFNFSKLSSNRIIKTTGSYVPLEEINILGRSVKHNIPFYYTI